jgi:hypothetical protein
MKIDFIKKSEQRKKLFNLVFWDNLDIVTIKIINITKQDNIKDLLKQIYSLIKNHCQDNQKPEEANKFYADYLHNLFYFICRNIKDKELSNTSLNQIINDKLFLFNKDDLWHDPIESYSALNIAAKENYYEIAKQLIAKAKTAYGGLNNDGFRKFITHKNKYGFSSLECAASVGHHQIAELIISKAKNAFKDDKNGFREFINN